MGPLKQPRRYHNDRNNLRIWTITQEYTYECQIGKSVIDLTLTCNLGAGIIDWKVSLAQNFSDHNTISFNIATEILELPAARPWAKADWDTFGKELEEHDWKPSKYITEKKMNQWVGRLTRVLTNTLNIACPPSPARTINKNNPSFTPQLKQLRIEVGAVYQKQKGSNSEHFKNV